MLAVQLLVGSCVMPLNAGNGRFNSNRDNVALVNRVVPSKPGTLKNGFGQQLVAERAAPAVRDVALRLERRGRLVKASPFGLKLAGPTADIAGFEADAPRQLSLHADGELLHGRNDEVRVREVRVSTEEGERAERRCPAAAERRSGTGCRAHRSVCARYRSRRSATSLRLNPLRHGLARGVQEVPAVAGSQHGLLVDLEGAHQPWAASYSSRTSRAFPERRRRRRSGYHPEPAARRCDETG